MGRKQQSSGECQLFRRWYQWKQQQRKQQQRKHASIWLSRYDSCQTSSSELALGFVSDSYDQFQCGPFSQAFNAYLGSHVVTVVSVHRAQTGTWVGIGLASQFAFRSAATRATAEEETFEQRKSEVIAGIADGSEADAVERAGLPRPTE